MAFVLKTRVAESSTTTGTGAFALAAALTAHQRFSAVCSVGDTTEYAIIGVDGSGAPTGEWESGTGTYSSANTLTRTTVVESSNSNAAVTFSAGSKVVLMTPAASRLGTNYVPANTAITGATKTKITYDVDGLVTAGADATTADIADSTNKRYVTDANLTSIGALGTAAAKNIPATGDASTSEVVYGTDTRLANARAASGGNAATVTNATLTTALTVNTGTVTLTGNAANTSALILPAGSNTLGTAAFTASTAYATSTQGGKADTAVQSVSVATANGVSGSSSGGTTPVLTLTLGAITPSSINGVTTDSTTNKPVTAASLIGGLLPASVNTLSASSTVSGAGFSTYLASPPAIGGTTPAAGYFSSLMAGSNNTAAYPLQCRVDGASSTTWSASSNLTATGAYGAGFIAAAGSGTAKYAYFAASADGNGSVTLGQTGILTLSATTVALSGLVTASSTVTASGTVVANNGVTIGGGSFAQGALYKSAALGLAVGSITGSSYDFSLWNPGAGTAIISVATGTTTVAFGGAVTMPSTLSLTGASSTLGYGTSAGQAVTQYTSRGATVTCNHPCGYITMFYAAGSATWSSFSVNNSLVAATDTVVLSVQYGATNIYLTQVIAVGGGAFTIAFATTGGTAPDSPIINFAIIKG